VKLLCAPEDVVLVPRQCGYLRAARYARRVDIELRATFAASTVDAIRAFVRGQATLNDVIVAGLTSRPARELCGVVIQDEYTHDVVLRWDDGVFVVYDTT